MSIPIYEIINSGSYWYPLKGLLYFWMHPTIWPFYLTVLIPQLTCSLVIYSLMFIFIYPTESVVYTLLIGPLGMIAAWYSLYSQSSTIAKFIITFTLLPYIQKIAYDAVLSRESHDVYLEFAKERRRRNTTYNIPVIRRIARYLHEMPDLSIFPFSLPKLFLLFMLNLIPVFGPIFVMFFQASSKGLQAHRRYFMLKGYSRSEIRERYKIDKPIYMAFGLTALLLEMVPILSVFFMFTNTIGAALWVVDLEKQEKLVSFEREEKTQLKMKPLIPNEPSIFNGEEPLLHTGTQLQTHGNLHYNES